MVESHSYDSSPDKGQPDLLSQLPKPPEGLVRRFPLRPPDPESTVPHLGGMVAAELSPEQKVRVVAALDVYEQLTQTLPVSDFVDGKTVSVETVVRLATGHARRVGEVFDVDDVYAVSEAALLNNLDQRRKPARELSTIDAFRAAALANAIPYQESLLRTIGSLVELEHGGTTPYEDVRYFDEEAHAPEQRAAAAALLNKLTERVQGRGTDTPTLSGDQVKQAYREYLDGQVNLGVDHDPLKLLHLVGASRRQRMALDLQGQKTEFTIATAVRVGLSEALGQKPGPTRLP